MTEAPEIITSFVVLQALDGSISIVTDTGVNQLREATNSDVYSMSHFVAKAVEGSVFRPPTQEPEKTVAQTLQEKLAERRQNAPE